jgi:hypothetical protein
MMDRKFNIGDRVEMTDEAKKCNPRSIQHGEVVRFGKKYDWEIFILRDGCKNPDGWHESAWQKESMSNTAR